jgi:hypothetical protein
MWVKYMLNSKIDLLMVSTWILDRPMASERSQWSRFVALPTAGRAPQPHHTGPNCSLKIIWGPEME